MYTNFFSLSELPFSIAPDPKYLFMSDRHREALTHLTHGLGGAGATSNGGFVLLTGEVGTGKTTVSRCLMADLPENTQLAFILNPTLSSQELMATICDQLKIRYRKTGATLKTLTDKISEKLLKNHENDINTLLIIDEALWQIKLINLGIPCDILCIAAIALLLNSALWQSATDSLCLIYKDNSCLSNGSK